MTRISLEPNNFVLVNRSKELRFAVESDKKESMTLLPHRSTPLFAIAGLVLGLALAPGTNRLGAEEKAPFDPAKAKDSGLGMPTPYDKFLALDIALGQAKVDWKSLYAKYKGVVDTDDLEDTQIEIPAALGVRIADGVMAIKARDAEALNECASDIEKLAEKLDVPEGDMARAKRVRAAANAGKWLEVFMELGFLQQDIMQKLATDGPRGDLLVLAGWMQGARYTTAVVLENYSPENSNFLREPKLADALIVATKKLPSATLNHKIGKAALEALPKMKALIDIPLTGSIPREGVEELHKLSTGVVEVILGAAE